MNKLLCFFLVMRLVDANQNATKVKLSTKQGLVMNQVLAFYSLENTKNPLCKNQTTRFKNALRNFEPWALKMFDSSSKVQPGVLLGNLIDFGSFKQCTELKFEDITGKHCLIKITPSLGLIKKILSFHNITEKRFPKIRVTVEKLVVLWSVCVPSSCSSDDVLDHFDKIITTLGKGLNINVSLDEEHCATFDSGPQIGMEQYLAIGILLFFPALSLLAPVLELGFENKALRLFSVSHNFNKILAQRQSSLDCIHGLRFLSTCYVVIGHRYLMAMFSPVINGLEIQDWILNYSSTIIIGGTVCVDTFFMISGLLTSLGFFQFVAINGNFNIIKFYLYRYFRITPTLSIVVLIYASLVEFLGSGPLWYDTCQAHVVPCQYFWWSTLLHIQSYVNPESLTWSLSCDMIFFYFSPVILYPLWKNNVVGFLNIVVLYVLSLIVSFYFAWINEYEAGMPITNQLFETQYFQKHYIAPHNRASTYIIGLAFGVIVYNFKEKKIEMNFALNVCGWVTATFLMIVPVVSCHIFQLEDYEFSKLDASLFLSLSRTGWTLGVIWVIWSCMNGYGTVVNSFLSLYLFQVLGKMSYSIYLLHLLLQLFKNGATKSNIYFSNFTTIYDSFADLMMVGIFSFLFTLFFEYPLNNLQTLLLNNFKVTPNHN